MKQSIIFDCNGEKLLGILHAPAIPRNKGVVVVVGGPQYRVGSHRQFLLLSNHLATENFPSFRFDYQGMGDSSGQQKDFENIEDDIRSAIDVFLVSCPEVTEIVLLGLCDAASAILFYAYKDPRVTGVVLLNPWVRSIEIESHALLKHYYLKKILHINTWHRMFTGKINICSASASLFSILKNRCIKRINSSVESSAVSLPERMLSGYKKFKGHSLIIISGEDLTAAEFVDTVSSSRSWKEQLHNNRVTWKELSEANHTFSTKLWRDQVSLWTTEWLNLW